MNTVIRYADLIRVCCIKDLENFGGYWVKHDGLYVVPPEDSALLSIGERAAISWHPTGHYDLPALTLPCTVGELQSFVAEAGLLGCIDEDELNAMMGASPAPPTAGEVSAASAVPLLPEQPINSTAIPASVVAAPSVVKHAANVRGPGPIPLIIEDIIEAQKLTMGASIWVHLKEAALESKVPFTGSIAANTDDGVKAGSLAYSDVRNSVKWYTRKQLTDYLGRRGKRLMSH